MAGSVDLKEFVAGFVLEADEYLHSVNRNLVATSEALKQGLPEPRAVRELFRALHTIKGLASMVGAEPIVDLAHEMEGILRAADRAGGRLPEASLDLLLHGTRAIEERVQTVSKHGVTAIPKAATHLLEALAMAQEQQAGQGRPDEIELSAPPEVLRSLSAADREQVLQALNRSARAVLIEFKPSPEKAAQGLNITAVRDRLGKLGDLVKVVPRSSSGAPTGISFSLLLITHAQNAILSETVGTTDDAIVDVVTIKSATLPINKPVPLDEEATDFTPRDQTSIRVDIRRLDEALERLSELVVTRSKLFRVATDMRISGVDTRQLDAVIAENTRQLKRLRTAITEARMVPLTELLQRLPLIVRGLTKDTSKSVNVIVRAGSAEVDKAVADKIMPAVVHLVRNAVDHAIESKEERAKLGKPEVGTVFISCDDSSGTNLVLTISDDGGGIDRQAVARQAGFAVARSDEELLDQITTPGLSTRKEVTHTSGRGMGMDIVKRTVDVLGGSLSMSTAAKVGTTFTVRAPVRVTIVDVLSFVSGGQIFVAPVAMVEEIIEVDLARLTASPAPSNQVPKTCFIERRGEAVPLLVLDSLLNERSDSKIPGKALIVRQNRGAIAFAVEKMLGRQEVVVRPLDDALVKVNGMSGATDLGDGQPTLVLDLTSLGAVALKNAAMAG